MSIACLPNQVLVGWTNLTNVRSLALRRASPSAVNCSSTALETSLSNALKNCGDTDLLRVIASGRLQAAVRAPPSPPSDSVWRQSYVPTPAPILSRAPLWHFQLTVGWVPRRGYRSCCPVVMATTVQPTCGDGGDKRAGVAVHQTAVHWLPRRYFKTHRSVEHEERRVPSVLVRLWQFLSSNPVKTHQQPVDASQVAGSLKDILSGSESETQKNKLINAFVEGYSASNSRGSRSDDTQSRIFGYLSRFLIRSVVVGVVIAAIVMTMMPMGRNVMFGKMGMDDVVPEVVDVSFGDVKGCDEAKQELQDIVAFLRDPERFSALGGKLPKGVLLTGPPGTGKTLLARAVAGEASVPFFHAAGSEFDEVFVGQGARRVRELFRVAKMRAPCVVFIDEIDSVGAKRTASKMHPYANQTINQLLSEMDGFHSNEGVIVMGATNRRDHLDYALLRPGRFDVEVSVDPPDLQGRKEIFQLYLDKIKVEPNVDVGSLARGTTGFTGADIENMVNQAALRAATLSSSQVLMQHLDWAKDRIFIGVERKNRLPDDEDNLVTAYHEGGHTIVALFTKFANPVHKVTIMPRSKSLGHTLLIPSKDEVYRSKAHLLAQMDVAMGGRAAEEIIFGGDHVTTGASDDLKRATSIASAMVREWGMSDVIGVRVVGDQIIEDLPSRSVSDKTMDLLDKEIKQLLQDSYERAKALLKAHSGELKALADALMKHETLNGHDLQQLIKTGSLLHLEGDTSSPPFVK